MADEVQHSFIIAEITCLDEIRSDIGLLVINVDDFDATQKSFRVVGGYRDEWDVLTPYFQRKKTVLEPTCAYSLASDFFPIPRRCYMQTTGIRNDLAAFSLRDKAEWDDQQQHSPCSAFMLCAEVHVSSFDLQFWLPRSRRLKLLAEIKATVEESNCSDLGLQLKVCSPRDGSRVRWVQGSNQTVVGPKLVGWKDRVPCPCRLIYTTTGCTKEPTTNQLIVGSLVIRMHLQRSH